MFQKSTVLRGGRWLVALVAVNSVVTGFAAPATIDFNREIRPILSENCFACHGPDQNKRKAGLRLDIKEDALKEIESGGFAIVPGKPAQSLLLKVVALPEDDDSRMPPAKTGKALTAAQIDLLSRWIADGAKYAEHWAYVPSERPSVPENSLAKSFARNPIDAFVFEKLREAKLKPNAEADRATLIRRASLDLTGLPPTVAEVDAFLADKNPDAYEQVVERLLASPHYGERMAMAWLDAARFADTAGYHFDGFRQMHLWRDWVIQSFNDNKPFDEFTIEQIAGDLLPNASIEQKIATGFHRNVMTTDEGGVDPEEYLTKYQVDRVSTTAQVWLGTTLACAECHDHKYDPISTKEFYQFYAFFNGIPEKGLDGTRVKNPAPVLRVPSPEQGSALLKLLDLIPAAEKAQADREAELPKVQEKWEKELGEVKSPQIAGLVQRWNFASVTNETIPALHGRALKLSGVTNEFFDAGQAVSFEFTNAFSYGAWIKLHGKTGTILSKMEEAPGHRGFDLIVSDRKVEVHLIHKFPDDAVKVVSKSVLPTNEWVHVFVTYDGSKKAAGVKLFVDGLTNAVDVSKDKLTATIGTESPLLLGSRVKAFPFNGLLADVRFYDRALKTNEVAELFAYPHLRIAKIAKDERSKEQRDELKLFFREHLATEFLAARERVTKLQKDKKELLDKIPDTMVMEEMEKPRDTFVLVRGNYQQKGERVTPNTPAFLLPLPRGAPTNRLALARWLVATNNPLTARVTVNRLWSQFFGTGLVKTANDFGSQGEQPSHPELLDWLACEFMSPEPNASKKLPRSVSHSSPHPWDVKHMVRLIVLSASYRQSAVVDEKKLQRDPYNRLLSRGPRLRLDAELIRDNALAVSGLLNAQIGGPSVKPYQPPGLWEITDHKYEQSKGADLYRRGMYVLWKRAAHYPSFQAFDAPSREVCTVQRQRTSTPLQSLVLMNDPAFVEAARALATRTLRDGGESLRDQVTFAFRTVLARPPRRDEIKVLERVFQEQHELFAKDAKAADSLLAVGESPRPSDMDAPKLAAMTSVANVLLNLNETITR